MEKPDRKRIYPFIIAMGLLFMLTNSCKKSETIYQQGLDPMVQKNLQTMVDQLLTDYKVNVLLIRVAWH